MGAAIEVQQLAEAGPRLAAAPVAAARPTLADEAGFLEGELDEAVGEGHAVLAAGEAIEVAHVPSAEPLAIEAQDALDLGGGRLAPRRPPAAPVIERDGAPGLVARPPAAHAAGINPQNVGRLPPGQGTAQCPH